MELGQACYRHYDKGFEVKERFLLQTHLSTM